LRSQPRDRGLKPWSPTVVTGRRLYVPDHGSYVRGLRVSVPVLNISVPVLDIDGAAPETGSR